MKYKTIVIDPPWEVKAGRRLGIYEKKDGKQTFKGDSDKARELAYKTMTMDEIKNIAIPADENCHLYLWVINKYLGQAFDVVKHWGFNYSTTLVWAKNPIGGGLGGCYGIATEYVLFCRKGNLKARTKVNTNWFNWKRPYKNGYPNHSAKPPEFYDLVGNISPAPRLDMFARIERDGWDVWGDQVENSIIL